MRQVLVLGVGEFTRKDGSKAGRVVVASTPRNPNYLVQPPKLRHFYPASRVMSCMLCPSASSITSFGVR